MKAIQYFRIGDPGDVLELREVDAAGPGPGQIRVRVEACGINPADWALCEGLFAGALPRGIGLEACGTVESVGPGVEGTRVDDVVLGPVPYAAPTAGAADLAVLDVWTPAPGGMDPLLAASLPMAGETAWRALDGLGVGDGQLVLVHGAGTVVGEVAVQLALHRGARVIATAGPARAADLEERGARVTTYGGGMVGRIAALAGGRVDRALDLSPVAGDADRVLADLVDVVGGDADRVLTVTHFDAARELGTRVAPGEPRHDVLPEVARLAASGEVSVPVARTFALAEFPDALAVSRSRRVGGKLIFVS